MGRKAMSPELQAARGNPGKRPVRKRESVKAVVAQQIVLARPTWLTDALAKGVWDKLLPALHFLRDSDVHVFGRYCIYVADWVTATRNIVKTGGAVYETSSAHVENMMRINPWFTARGRIEDDLVKLEEKLGLTPLDRQRIISNLANAARLPTTDLFGADGAREGEEGAGASPPQPAGMPMDIDTIGGLSGKPN